MAVTLSLVFTPISTSNCAFILPEDVVVGLGGGRRPKIVATVGEYSWRTSISPMGGRFLLGLSAANRAAAGDLVADKTYPVTIELDTAPRVVEVPADLAKALADDPMAAQRWGSLSYSSQKEIAVALTGAKKPETRTRRLAQALARLGV